jgi:hypothetical protein
MASVAIHQQGVPVSLDFSGSLIAPCLISVLNYYTRVKLISVIANFHICFLDTCSILTLIYHCLLLMTITMVVVWMFRHPGLLFFVSWVSLILCFADSFCFVKSVPAGIPELGVYYYFRSKFLWFSLFLCFADNSVCLVRSSAWLLSLQ